MAELGKAYVQIVPSAKGISGKITKELSGETDEAGKSAGESWGKKFAALAKKAILSAGVGKVISEAISQGSELQQNLGGTEAVWQGFADTIQSTATEAYKNMGMSASDYMATANKIGTLMQGSGIDQAAALQMTTDAMQRAADVASVMGISTEEAMNAITGAAKGNFTMMDNIGVAMNATTIEAYAKAKKGWEDFSWNTATNAQKTALAMEMFMEQTGQYAGNFARESAETMSGSLGAMKSAFEDLLGNLALGRSVEGPLKNLQTTVTAYLRNLLPAVSGIVTKLPTLLLSTVVALAPDLIRSGTEMLGGIVTGFSASVPLLITNIITAISTIGDTLLAAAPELLSGGLALVEALATGIVKALPYLASSIPVVIEAIIGTLSKSLPAIMQTGARILTALVDNLPAVIDNITKAIPQIVTAIVTALVGMAPQLVETGVTLLISLVTGLVGTISQLVDALPQIWDAIKTSFAGVDWAALGSELLEKIKGAIATGGPALATAVTELTGKLREKWDSIDWKKLGSNLITKIKSGIANGVTLLRNEMNSLGTKAKDKFKEIDWKALGTDMINGIKTGLANAANSLYTSVKDIIKNALGAGKKEAEVGSPSKLFARELGRWIPAGIAVGIEDNLAPVDRAIRGAIDSAAEAMPSEALPATAAGPSINVYMTVSGAEDPAAWAETFARSLKRQVRMGAI
ncbi:MAG: hypothetical protein IJ713_01345 [Oscillibacter sp.]|nr:hypothetical protein [Oscillibacter sp.]